MHDFDAVADVQRQCELDCSAAGCFEFDGSLVNSFDPSDRAWGTQAEFDLLKGCECAIGNRNQCPIVGSQQDGVNQRNAASEQRIDYRGTYRLQDEFADFGSAFVDNNGENSSSASSIPSSWVADVAYAPACEKQRRQAGSLPHILVWMTH
jgi:hypothetical protein